MTRRKCCAEGCPVMVQSRYLMCPSHWNMVSMKTCRAVYSAYRAGQETGNPAPSAEWREAADRAIEEVKRREQSNVGR